MNMPFGEGLDVDTPYTPQQGESQTITARETPGPIIAEEPKLRDESARLAKDESARLTTPVTGHLNTGQLLIAALGGPQAGSALRNQMIQRQLSPLISEYGFKVDKALKAGDLDSAEALTSQLTQYSDMSPAIQQLAQRYMPQIAKKRGQVEENGFLADMILSNPEIAKDSSLYRNAAMLKAHPGLLDSTRALEIIKASAIKSNISEGFLDQIDQLSGALIGRKAVAQGVTPKTMSPDEVKAYNIEAAHIMPIEKYAEIRNKVNNHEALGDTKAEDMINFLKVHGIMYGGNGVQGAVAKTIGMERLPAAIAIEKGLEPGAPGLTGTGPTQTPLQLQTSKDVINLGQQLQLTQPQLGAFKSILAQESSGAHPDKLLHDKNSKGEYTGFGPGAVHQGALDDVNQKLGTKFTLDDIKNDPRLGTFVSANYFKIQLDRNNNDIDKAVVGYNGGGDPNYLRNVKLRAAELKAQAPNIQGIQPQVNQNIQAPNAQQQPITPVITQGQFPTAMQIPTQAPKPPFPEFVSDPNKTEAQNATAKGQWLKQKERYEETRVTQQALTQEEPLKETGRAFKMNSAGKLEQPTERISADEAARKGWYTTSDPQKLAVIENYSALEKQKNEAVKALNALEPGKFNEFNRILGKIASRGFNLPVVGNLNLGTAALPQEFRDAYSKLSAFAQASEQFLNPEGKPNSEIESLKSGIVGRTATLSQSAEAIHNLFNIARDRVSGMMEGVKGAVTPTNELPAIRGPRDNAIVETIKNVWSTYQQWNAEGVDKIEQKKRLEEIKSRADSKPVTDFIDKLDLSSKRVRPDERQDRPNFGPFIRSLDESNGRTITPEEQKALSKYITSGGAPGEPLSTYEAVTPHWARKPINKETQKNLRKLHE